MQKENDDVFSASGFYGGYSAKGNFDLELKVFFTEENMADALQFVAGIGQHMQVIAMLDTVKVKLGTWSTYRVTVDRNGRTTVVLKTNKEHAFVDSLSKLMVEDSNIIFKAKIIEQ